MKKIITFTLAFVLCLCMTMTAFASGNQTVVSLEVDENLESYELVIPATVSIDPGEKTGSVEVKLENVELIWTKTINVYVNSSNPDHESDLGAFLVNTADSEKKIHYKLTSGMNQWYIGQEMVTLSHYWEDREYLTVGGAIQLEVDGAYPGSGTYTDTLTFRVETLQ